MIKSIILALAIYLTWLSLSRTIATIVLISKDKKLAGGQITWVIDIISVVFWTVFYHLTH